MAENNLPEMPGRFNFSPECQLLIASSWVAPPALEQVQAKKISELCSGNIEWNTFIELVDRHRVPALAYLVLRKYAEALLPADVLMKLKMRSNQARMQALGHSAELNRLLRIFAHEGINVISLKGVLLSLRLFGDPCVRHSKDLDLLIRHEDLDRVDCLLVGEGYCNTFPGRVLTSMQKRYVKDGFHHYEYVHNKNGINVEVHWNCDFWTSEHNDILWQSSSVQKWMGVPVQILDDETLLLYQCDHGAGHQWFRIKWLSDVATMLSQKQHPEWDAKLIVMGSRLNLRQALAQAMLLLHWLYSMPLPKTLCDLIKDERETEQLACTAIKAILLNEKEIMTAGKRLKSLWQAMYLLKLKPSLTLNILLKRILIVPEDFRFFPLPGCLFWLYIPLRPLSWFWRNYIKL